MFMTRSEYDRGVNTFSPEGRIFQVEYAIEAIKLGSTVVAIKTNEGVVMAVEKRITSPLIIPNSMEKIFEIDKHIACASSGLMADARTLVDRARVEAQNYQFVYNEPISVESLSQAVSNLALQFGDDDSDAGSMSRPFGVAILFAGFDDTGPHLFHLDPSGTFLEYEAKAIGSGAEAAQQSLQEVFNKEMTLKDATRHSVQVLKSVMEEKLAAQNVEIATVTRATGYHILERAEIDAVLREINA